jgi:serine protease AprX
MDPYLLIGVVGLASFVQDPGTPAQVRVELRGEAHAIVAQLESGDVVVHQTPSAVEDLTLRGVPGSPALAATWTERADGVATPWYALSLDGALFHASQPTSYELELRYARFDPLRAQPAVPAFLDGERFGARLFIVQYWTQGLEDYRAALAALGAREHLFLAQHANVVELDPARLDEVRALEFVRWVGPYHPAYKLESELFAELQVPELGPAERKVNVLSTERGAAGQAPILAQLASLGARLDELSEPTHLLTLTLPLGRLADLARLDAVQWIDRWSAPEQDMDIARNFHGANFVESVGNYLGQGVRVEVMDGGCDTSHPDLQNFLIHSTNVLGDHGTCTSGIVVGSGAGNFSARGVMPQAFLVVGYYNNFAGGSRYAHTAQLTNPALAYECVLQSNSWGSALTTSYTSVSQNMDLILFDNDRFSILQSQSNAGTQSSRPEAWAKNILSVGGIRHFNTESKSNDSWTNGASIGPAADGRIKPDLASFYDSINCTDIVGASGYASGNYYSSFGGTSGATPITAGLMGLLYQMWSDGLFGNATPGSTVFDNRPYNTTAKALLINTATQWTFSGTTHDLTRTHQGWGHADVRSLYDLRAALYIVDESDVLANLASTTHPLTVQPATPAFKATLVYRDRPGTTASTQHRINNLDLKVTAPDGTVFWGNNGLSAGNWSTAGGVANTKDTVENVFVQSPLAGSWQVQVIAAELNQDAHLETGTLDTDYALVVSGVTSGPPPQPPAAPSGLSATATSSSAISLAWTDNSGDETGFEIERSADGVNFLPRATVGANVTSFEDSGLAASTIYFYRVNATNGGGDSGYSNVASATTQASTGPVSLFSDGFESGNLTAGGWTTQNSNASASTGSANAGSWGARVRRTSWMQKSLSTAGYNTIHLKYARRTQAMDAAENLFVEWFNGSVWTAVETTKSITWASQDMTLPAGAAGNPAFAIRFRTNCSNNNEYASIDSVEVTGVSN